MRALLAFATALLLPIAAAGAQPAAGGERHLASEAGPVAANALGRGVERALSALQEPPLATREDLGRFRRRLRLLVRPGSGPAYSIRVDERRSGGAQVRFAALRYGQGYDPTSLAHDVDFALDQSDVAELDRLVEVSQLRTLPVLDDTPTGDWFCVDGTGYLIGMLDARGAHWIERTDCYLRGPLLTLITTLDRLRR